jgi:hypothetical protein
MYIYIFYNYNYLLIHEPLAINNRHTIHVYPISLVNIYLVTIARYYIHYVRILISLKVKVLLSN